MADEVERVMKLRGDPPISVEGYDNAEWILVDFGDMVVNVFTEGRAFLLRPRPALPRRGQSPHPRPRRRRKDRRRMRAAALALLLALPAAAWDLSQDLLDAARKGDLAGVTAALENKADIESKTRYGQTPLFLAAMNGHVEVVQLLIDKGAKVDVTDNFYKTTAIGFAASRKHAAVVKLLLPKSTDVDRNLDTATSLRDARSSPPSSPRASRHKPRLTATSSSLRVTLRSANSCKSRRQAASAWSRRRPQDPGLLRGQLPRRRNPIRRQDLHQRRKALCTGQWATRVRAESKERYCF